MSPGLTRREHVVAQAQLVQRAGAVVLGQHVGVAHHPQQDLLAPRMLQVQGDAALVAVHHQERRRDAVDARLAVAARVVAARQLLDLDHVGAHVGEHQAGRRAGHDLREFEHAHAGERTAVRRPRRRLLLWAHRVSVRRSRASSSRGTPSSRCGSPRCRSSRSTRRVPAALSGPPSARRCANFLCQRATSGAPSAMRSRGRARLGRDLVVRHDARHQPLVLRLGRVEHAALEQDLERDGAADQADQRRHLGVRHHEPEVLDRRAEAARRAADADVGQRRDLEAAADADAVDLRDDRRRQFASFSAVPCITLPYSIACALLERCGLELADVVARRERLLARAAQDDAADASSVLRQAPHGVAQSRPHRAGEGVQLVRAVQHDGGDGAIAFDEDRFGHAQR